MTSFTVCKQPSGIGFPTYVFQLGALTPGSGKMGVLKYPPFELNVSLEKTDGILFRYTVYVDCNPSPFGGDPPHPAHYRFYDESGDSYFLECLTPTLHEVSFNSEQPNILKIEIAGKAGIGDYWSDAPECSGLPPKTS